MDIGAVFHLRITGAPLITILPISQGCCGSSHGEGHEGGGEACHGGREGGGGQAGCRGPRGWGWLRNGSEFVQSLIPKSVQIVMWNF